MCDVQGDTLTDEYIQHIQNLDDDGMDQLAEKLADKLVDRALNDPRALDVLDKTTVAKPAASASGTQGAQAEASTQAAVKTPQSTTADSQGEELMRWGAFIAVAAVVMVGTCLWFVFKVLLTSSKNSAALKAPLLDTSTKDRPVIVETIVEKAGNKTLFVEEYIPATIVEGYTADDIKPLVSFAKDETDASPLKQWVASKLEREREAVKRSKANNTPVSSPRKDSGSMNGFSMPDPTTAQLSPRSGSFVAPGSMTPAQAYQVYKSQTTAPGSPYRPVVRQVQSPRNVTYNSPRAVTRQASGSKGYSPISSVTSANGRAVVRR
jgi:hypothetical protein